MLLLYLQVLSAPPCAHNTELSRELTIARGVIASSRYSTMSSWPRAAAWKAPRGSPNVRSIAGPSGLM